MENKEEFTLPVFSLRRRFNQLILLVFLILLLAGWGSIATYFAFTSIRELLQADPAALALTEGAAAPATAVPIETLRQLSTGLLQALAVGIVIALVLAFIMFTFVTAGVRTVALEVWIRRMGAGDLEYKVEIEGNDELAESARALEELRQRSIKAMQLDLVKELSEDLERKNQELERVLRELQQTQEQIILREKLAELGELTAGVAHEIRNPLNFMKNFSEASDELLAELKVTLDHNAAELDQANRQLIDDICQNLSENLERIRSHGDRANRIVRDMLMLGRGGGTMQLVEINDLLKEHTMLAFHSARALDPDFRLDIEEELDKDAGRVPVISEDLGRVFLNMVGNACYATDEKSRLLEAQGETFTPTLWIRTMRVEDAVEIRIRDNGTGIPTDVMEKVFNPFFTTKPADKGTGLGLSLSNDIVRQHGGTISPTSEPGEFTEMTISIPVS